MTSLTKYIAAGLVLAMTGAAVADQCAPTPGSFLGNNYAPGVATWQTDVGKGLVLRGRVLSAPDCKPIPHAVIERWQAGNNGRYQDRLRALMKPSEDGSYRFETEWPDMPIPHIHFKVTAEGYESLTTQWIPSQKTSEAVFDLILAPDK